MNAVEVETRRQQFCRRHVCVHARLRGQGIRPVIRCDELPGRAASGDNVLAARCSLEPEVLDVASCDSVSANRARQNALADHAGRIDGSECRRGPSGHSALDFGGFRNASTVRFDLRRASGKDSRTRQNRAGISLWKERSKTMERVHCDVICELPARPWREPESALRLSDSLGNNQR